MHPSPFQQARHPIQDTYSASFAREAPSISFPCLPWLWTLDWDKIGERPLLVGRTRTILLRHRIKLSVMVRLARDGECIVGSEQHLIGIHLPMPGKSAAKALRASTFEFNRICSRVISGFDHIHVAGLPFCLECQLRNVWSHFG